MNRGLYIATQGMTTQMKKMDIISNNIANVNTAGFKRDDVVTRSFNEELMLKQNDEDKKYMPPRIGTMNFGVTVDNIYTDFTQGSYEKTDNPLDLGIEGDGFFKVMKISEDGKEEIRYTRDGSFTISSNNTLVTKNGEKVLGKNGEITIGTGKEISISEEGMFYVDEELVDEIDIVIFKDNEFLKKEGNNLYIGLDGLEEKEEKVKLLQGFRETGNVNPVKEMVEMITLSRAYETNQKIITTYDTLMSKSANEIGKK